MKYVSNGFHNSQESEHTHMCSVHGSNIGNIEGSLRNMYREYERVRERRHMYIRNEKQKHQPTSPSVAYLERRGQERGESKCLLFRLRFIYESKLKQCDDEEKKIEA